MSMKVYFFFYIGKGFFFFFFERVGNYLKYKVLEFFWQEFIQVCIYKDDLKIIGVKFRSMQEELEGILEQFKKYIIEFELRYQEEK